MTSKTVKRLYRGDYPLPHQCQVVRRDLHAEKISRYLGGKGHGWRMSPEQMHEAAQRSEYREYFVTGPDSVTLPWTAFRDRAEMDIFCAAYGLQVDPADPAPGSRFELLLPGSTDAFAPLVESDEDYRLR